MVTGTALGIEWGGRRRAAVAVVLAAAILLSFGGAGNSDRSALGDAVSVIVQRLPGAGAGPEQTVERLGGTVERRLDIIDGFTAEVPENQLTRLAESAGVRDVTRDSRVHLLDDEGATTDAASSSGRLVGTLANVGRMIRADRVHDAGVTGKGVDVALIDSGVVPVDGLTGSGKVVNGADLSFESGHDEVRHLDTYGHGTHLAGIIAANSKDSRGIAPGARIVNVKVASADGATDVSQVIAALDWVVQHRQDGDLNIRIVNLAFGTDSDQSYLLDPLAYAAEVAWHKGLVVVVSAGNEGFGSSRLNNPATDPWLLAVGASDPNGTVGISDDTVADFSSRGEPTRRPDVVAPGRSVVSLRDPGSWIDTRYPEARVGETLFKGSGTSQSAAVVSGAAALLLQARPKLSPDRLKVALLRSARPLDGQDPLSGGHGLVNVERALTQAVPDRYTQTWAMAQGTGSLEASRGSVHVGQDGAPLTGEQDVFGEAWDGSSWSGSSWSGSSWSGGSWDGSSWSGSSWSGGDWNGSSWSGSSWSGSSWSGSSWSGSSWSGSSWSGSSWSGSSWSGSSWSGSSWSGSSWSGSSWSSAAWGDL